MPHKMTVDDARLLGALARHEKRFDASTISSWVHGDPALLAALQPILSPRFRSSRWLTETARNQIQRWFDQIEGREIDGLYLTRDRMGWCSVREIQRNRMILPAPPVSVRQ